MKKLLIISVLVFAIAIAGCSSKNDSNKGNLPDPIDSQAVVEDTAQNDNVDFSTVVDDLIGSPISDGKYDFEEEYTSQDYKNLEDAMNSGNIKNCKDLKSDDFVNKCEGYINAKNEAGNE